MFWLLSSSLLSYSRRFGHCTLQLLCQFFCQPKEKGPFNKWRRIKFDKNYLDHFLTINLKHVTICAAQVEIYIKINRKSSHVGSYVNNDRNLANVGQYIKYDRNPVNVGLYIMNERNPSNVATLLMSSHI